MTVEEIEIEGFQYSSGQLESSGGYFETNEDGQARCETCAHWVHEGWYKQRSEAFICDACRKRLERGQIS